MTGIHTCHWPGCTKPVVPAMWGCRAHWFKLPLHLRNRIWAAYVGGQEITKTPSAEYLEAARAAQEWIAALPRVTKKLAALDLGPERGR